jgi:hypothetical protein
MERPESELLTLPMEVPFSDGLTTLVEPLEAIVLLVPGMEVILVDSLVGLDATAAPRTVSDRRVVKVLEKNMVNV